MRTVDIGFHSDAASRPRAVWRPRAQGPDALNSARWVGAGASGGDAQRCRTRGPRARARLRTGGFSVRAWRQPRESGRARAQRRLAGEWRRLAAGPGGVPVV
jgi:hypothetical protein